jgi:hypothetical protein
LCAVASTNQTVYLEHQSSLTGTMNIQPAYFRPIKFIHIYPSSHFCHVGSRDSLTTTMSRSHQLEKEVIPSRSFNVSIPSIPETNPANNGFPHYHVPTLSLSLSGTKNAMLGMNMEI